MSSFKVLNYYYNKFQKVSKIEHLTSKDFQTEQVYIGI